MDVCGRYQIIGDGELTVIQEILNEINKGVAVSEELKQIKTGEMCPMDMAAVLVAEGGIVVPKPMRWGFPQHTGRGVIINARRETLRERPTFRNLVEGKRCIVPASGFYEWKQVSAKKKDKYYVYDPSKPLFMAGLYNTVRGWDGRPYLAYVVITTDADAVVGEIHDRMPVIISHDTVQLWLDEHTEREVIDQILADAAPVLQTRKVW